MIQGSRAKQIRAYTIKRKTVENNPKKIIADVQNMVDWYNRAIDNAIKAGVPKKYLPTRGTKIKKSGIRSVQQAERTLNKIRELAWSEVASPRDYKRLIRAAEKEYGKGRRFKLIRDPNNPYKVVAVPYGSNKKAEPYTPKEKLSDVIGHYWTWYWDKGQLFFDSRQAAKLLDEALEMGEEPITHAQEYVRRTYREEYESNRDLFEEQLDATKYF